MAGGSGHLLVQQVVVLNLKELPTGLLHTSPIPLVQSFDRSFLTPFMVTLAF